MTRLAFVPNVLRVDYYWSESTPCGSSRIFLRYTGNPATAGDVSAVLQGVVTSAAIRFPPVLPTQRKLAAVRVTDLTSDTAPVAEDTTGWTGTRTGTVLPLNCSVHLQFKILRQYKGGRPRIALPFLNEGDTTDGRNWLATPLNDAGIAFTSHMNELNGPHGGITIDAHVNVSYYSGSTGKVNDDGTRGWTVPTKRTVAVVDKVVQIVPKTIMGSSRRRLRAHTGAP